MRKSTKTPGLSLVSETPDPKRGVEDVISDTPVGVGGAMTKHKMSQTQRNFVPMGRV